MTTKRTSNDNRNDNGRDNGNSNYNGKGNRRSFDCAVRKMRERLRSG